MDTRIALENRTMLKFYNSDNGVCVYTIENELARGASCIVYEATYVNNSGTKKVVRIKECYPFTLTIERCADGSLVPIESDRNKFEERKDKMRFAFDLGNELFNTSGLTNFTSNTVDIYELNNTIYVVTTYQEGATLSYHRFSSLKDCIAVVKSTAKVIAKIHTKGYLYLDIKPENIFSLAGTYDIVQLFDFDSLVPMKAMEQGTDDCEYKISYTKGFSALELKIGNQKKVGKHTDVYAIGAVLFYLIFGIAPEALDCEMDAEYEYGRSKYAEKTFQDKLYYELTDFFHNTLANYHLDRYQDMQQAIVKLEEIEKLADTSIPYIQHSHIVCPKILVGRNKELSELGKWIEQPSSNIIFVTGMGGIGKSSLVRGFLSEQAHRFDTVISLNYHHSLKQTIADDKQFVINAVLKNEQEEPDEYFHRKLSVARKITNGQKIVLVIDNYEGDNFDGIDELLKLGWKIIIITRNSILAKEYPCISVEAIKDKADIYTMFESYIRRSIEDDEYPVIDRIIDEVQGHTLALELIVKQIENSFLSVYEAEDLLYENGFSGIAPEKVPYTKDCVSTMDTIKNIIDKLFLSANITEQKKSVLKAIAFFGTNGIPSNVFADIYGLETKDIINELIMAGWLSVNKHTLVMHPVIIETVLGWKITEEFWKAANFMMDELKKMLPADKELLLGLSEEFLNCCNGHTELTSQQSYRELLFSVLSLMPRHREEYILINAIRLTQNLGALNGNAVVKLYDLISEIYEERQELEEAYRYIMQAQPIINKFADEHIKGQYYYLWVGYFDNKLGGWYTTTNREEEKILDSLKKALDKAIKHMKKSQHPDNKKLLAEYLRCKANILIRSNPKMKIRISALLNRAETIIKQEGLEYSEFACGYYLTWAWYYTYVEPNGTKLSEYISQAYDVETKICENDLDIIDNLFVPVANILLESRKENDSAEWLNLGIKLCDENDELLPFVRKKMELYTYLLDIYRLAENEEKYLETIDVIKEVNEQYEEFGIFIEISE